MIADDGEMRHALLAGWVEQTLTEALPEKCNRLSCAAALTWLATKNLVPGQSPATTASQLRAIDARIGGTLLDTVDLLDTRVASQYFCSQLRNPLTMTGKRHENERSFT
jgi:hypothetical protein